MAPDQFEKMTRNITVSLSAATHFAHADILDATEQFEEALKARLAAMEVIKSFSPSVTSYTEETSAQMKTFVTAYGMQLGLAYMAMKEYENAEKFINEVMEVRRKLDTKNYFRVSGEGILGTLYCATGRLTEAEPLLQSAMDKLSWSPDCVLFLTAFATLRSKQGRFQDSLELFESALKLTRKYFGTDHPFLLKVLNPYIEAVEAQGDRGANQALLELASQIRNKWNIRSPKEAA